MQKQGAETFALLLFLKDEFRKHFLRLGEHGPRLLLATQSLHRVVEIWNEHEWVVPPAARQECFDSWIKFMELMRPFGCYTAKHHMMIHLLGNMKRHGNPKYYSTWQDEALNKTLKAFCRQVYWW